jgi:SAM-dependent methyltransferase
MTSSTLTLENPRYFDRLARIESDHWWSLGMWRLAEEWLDKALAGRRGLRALDVGCGAGMTRVRLSRRPEIADAVALDPSLVAIERARDRQPGGLVLGDAMNLPFLDDSVDLVTCFDVFQHLPAHGDRRAAREIHRVLRPGGFALIRTNGRGGWRDDGLTPAPYDPQSLGALVQAAGFEVERRTYANCLPALAQEWRGRWRSKVRASRAGHPAGKGLAIDLPHPWINGLMAAISTAEAIAAGRWGWDLPFGHSTMVLARTPATRNGGWP